MWPCITELRATGSETFTGWESTVGDKESDEAEDLSQSFRTAAKRALPAVVVIKTSNRMQTADGANGDEDSSWPGLGHSADDEDFDWLNQWKWTLTGLTARAHTPYAYRGIWEGGKRREKRGKGGRA